MKKFNRKEAIQLLDSSSFKRKMDSRFESINSGWVIYWKGKAVKPTGGNNHYFASYNAALQSIERNIYFGDKIKKIISKGFYGVEYLSNEYEELFRWDLKWDKYYVDGKLISRHSRSKPLTAEEENILIETYSEERKFLGFCDNVLKTFFIKEWLADGTLEIKNI